MALVSGWITLGSSQVYTTLYLVPPLLPSRELVIEVSGEGIEIGTYLGEGAVVPEIALVGEAVADISELALLDILLDGVEELLLGDL